jgi:hypothetical protein
MGVTLQQEEGNVRVLRATGMLKKSELDAVLTAEAEKWGPATRIKVLVIADKFEGWERNEEWGDVSFFMKHGDQIEKIAIVADPKWEDDLMIFAAAGFRRAPVKFFPSGQIMSARAWLG